MEKINSSQFIKLMTNQPFFVWNSLDQEDIEDTENFEFQIPSFLNDLDEVETSFSEIQAKSFGIITTFYKDWLKNRFKNISFLKAKSLEDRVIETKKLLDDPSVRYIYNPVFGFEYKDHFVYSILSLYDKEDKVAYFQKFSTSTKKKDFLKMFFDVEVMTKIGIKVNEVGMHILATQEYKRGEISFYETDRINTSKEGRKDSDARKSFDYVSHQLAKAGKSKNKKEIPCEPESIIELISNPSLVDKKVKPAFSTLDTYIERIINAKNITEHQMVSEYDNSIWINSKNWKKLLSIHKPEWSGFSGNIYSKKDIIEDRSPQEASENSKTLERFLDAKKPKINDLKFVTSIINKIKDNKVVWYDFEAFSLPLAPMDSFLPFEQIVSQVSIIITDREKETHNENLVIDPKTINFDSFIKIIDSIFKEDHYYVVYNKSYENSRLNEMVRTLSRHKHKKAKEAESKVDKIIKNTIDLADLFICHKNKLPNILIPELKGLYSIKLLEKYINSKYPNFDYKIKEYKNLEIKQGMMAMEAANNRALGITGDAKWDIVTDQLKEYCENDVRAMIMVYYFIKKLLNN